MPSGRSPSDDVDLPDQVTEDGCALAFTAMYADRMRFDHSVGRWYGFAGDHWRQETNSAAFD